MKADDPVQRLVAPDSAAASNARIAPADNGGPASNGPVPPDRVRVWYDAFQRLQVSIDGQAFVDVQPRRLFPVSGRCDYISFLGEKDREVLLLSHPEKLDRESRKALRKALERMYFRARILRVYEIKEISGGVCLWRVRTDRGHANFEVVERNDRIQFIPPGRYLITDVDGNRFEIEDVRALDAASQSEVYHET